MVWFSLKDQESWSGQHHCVVLHALSHVSYCTLHNSSQQHALIKHMQ
jgi:hypothetical protein